MKCWISNGFHRESQVRLPRPTPAALPQVFLTPWSVFVLGRQNLALVQVCGCGGGVTPWATLPCLQVFAGLGLCPFPASPLVGLSFFWSWRRVPHWQSPVPAVISSVPQHHFVFPFPHPPPRGLSRLAYVTCLLLRRVRKCSFYKFSFLVVFETMSLGA